MQRPSRRKPLGLDKHMPVPEQFAAVPRKDQLNSLTAMSLHQSCPDAPQLISNRVNQFDALQTGGSVICRLSEVRPDHPLTQQLFHLVQVCHVLDQGGLRPVWIAPHARPTRPTSSQAAGRKHIDRTSVLQRWTSRCLPLRATFISKEGHRAAALPDQPRAVLTDPDLAL
jgi:hypothetical protein